MSEAIAVIVMSVTVRCTPRHVSLHLFGTTHYIDADIRLSLHSPSEACYNCRVKFLCSLHAVLVVSLRLRLNTGLIKSTLQTLLA
jgi:hypothetical protein